MSLSRWAIAAVLLLAGCTVEPLANARSDSAIASGTPSGPLGQSVTIDPVKDRVTQQLRNALMFSLYGGSPPVSAPYRVALTATATDQVLAIRGTALAPTAAKVSLVTTYALTEVATGTVVDSGTQTTIAAYDRTSQSFANERARRDAEDRAAQQAAQRIRLALSRALAAR